MSSSWLRVTATSPSEELNGLLAEGLLACGGTAIEEQGDALVTYIRLADDAGALLGRIRATLTAILGVQPAQFEAEEVPEQDWLALWRSGLEPRRIGARIVVSPTWSEIDDGSDELVIRMDPQMAFGTGEHASTRGVLRLMQDLDLAGAHLLDVGSGSGILSIAGALLGAQHVVAVECDPEAIPNAAGNIDRNGVGDRITMLCGSVDDPFLAVYGGGAFDGILANVLSSALRPLLPAFHRALAADGWAILSGILVAESAEMRHTAEQAGFAVASEDVEEQWWSVTLRRI
ncbi:MAG TPA: 50S ribosomal protein L11 methyltransferase [Longimicrobiales bacterium]